VIEKTQVLEMLVQACPTFAVARDEHVAEYGNDVLYVAAGEFAHHLLNLQLDGATSCFAQIGAAIERMHIEGTPEVKELATNGLIEGIQNVWGNCNANPELFLEYMGPESCSWWYGLSNFWSGKAPVVRSGTKPLIRGEA
jgi:hypothetical protein